LRVAEMRKGGGVGFSTRLTSLFSGHFGALRRMVAAPLSFCPEDILGSFLSTEL